MEEIKLTTKTTKKSLITTINELVDNYNEKDVAYFLCSFLPNYNDISNEDRGKTIKYVEDVINTHFTVKQINNENIEIINAINFSIKHFNEIKPQVNKKTENTKKTKKKPVKTK